MILIMKILIYLILPFMVRDIIYQYNIEVYNDLTLKSIKINKNIQEFLDGYLILIILFITICFYVFSYLYSIPVITYFKLRYKGKINNIITDPKIYDPFDEDEWKDRLFSHDFNKIIKLSRKV